ncbi:Fe-S protein assembly co-chaperone HscB [Urbifossiella limnaea]|uniref:Co-chaperone protein HscB n=1 Tax=Urbifossiella limnaea TaxID=2528023 RepID=A0A517XRM4_9BACT|nr:Fe-S protein assembly co-chaperone HscB [Urbifossiella limnaea]QDU20164.1 Co-chaperone protein HscB [Urbifossiella limnaea]
MDHFTRLGLPRRFVVDAAALERAYLAQSRAVHPDYHAAGAAADLAASTDLSAAVNEAYTTLRDPFARADYLLGLLGGPPASQEKGVEPTFLAEVMDLRERAEDAIQHAAVRADIEERSAALMTQVADGFARVEAGDAGRLVAVRRSLNALKTLRSLARALPED